MKYKIAVFDMDGTILDTLDDLADSTNYALRTNGLPQRTVDEVRRFVGNGIGKLIERAVPQGTDDAVRQKVFDTFTTYYKDHAAIKTKPYDGIKETVHKLKEAGVITAVVSNKADFAVQSLCRDYFDGLFDMAVGEKEGIRRKPAPDSVLAVLERFGLQKEDGIYIGDSDVDYNTAINSGLAPLMVGWGFREESFLMEIGAPFVIHKPEEMIDIIL